MTRQNAVSFIAALAVGAVFLALTFTLAGAGTRPFHGDVDCDSGSEVVDADAVDALRILQFAAGLPYDNAWLEGCPRIGDSIALP